MHTRVGETRKRRAPRPRAIANPAIAVLMVAVVGVGLLVSCGNAQDSGTTSKSLSGPRKPIAEKRLKLPDHYGTFIVDNGQCEPLEQKPGNENRKMFDASPNAEIIVFQRDSVANQSGRDGQQPSLVQEGVLTPVGDSQSVGEQGKEKPKRPADNFLLPKRGMRSVSEWLGQLSRQFHGDRPSWHMSQRPAAFVTAPISGNREMLRVIPEQYLEPGPYSFAGQFFAVRMPEYVKTLSARANDAMGKGNWIDAMSYSAAAKNCDPTRSETAAKTATSTFAGEVVTRALEAARAALAEERKQDALYIASAANDAECANEEQRRQAIGLIAQALAFEVKNDEVILLKLSGGVRLEMVKIPAGSFKMGSEPGAALSQKEEMPLHEVTIAYEFYIGKFEVTQAQWEAVMGKAPSGQKGDYVSEDARMGSWDSCQMFIKKLNQLGIGTFRLPSEAEWEYCCRAGSSTSWSFGDDKTLLGNYACCYPGAGGRPVPVGSNSANAWGLYDMHGNLSEGVQDWFHETYNGAPTDGKAWEAPTGTHRVYRGGSWAKDAQGCRSASRDARSADYAGMDVGLRLVRTMTPVPDTAKADREPEELGL